MIENQVISKLANKMIREINVIQEEQKYIGMKFPRKNDLIDARARLNILRLLKTVVVIKYYYRLNLYSERDSLINSNKTIVECLKYSAIET